jgi:glycosyltransferase involved in cell wall biosynthesis
MSYKPMVSVVVPTYNRAQQTIAAIESVLAQTYSCFEIIVVNDGSTDGSGELVRRFVTEKSNSVSRIVYTEQPNQGPSVARNTGIAKAVGKYIAFLDSDDIWLPEKLESQVRVLEDLKCGACFTDARLVNRAGMDASSFQAHGRRYAQTITIDSHVTASLANSFSGFWVSTLLVRSELVRQIGGFDPDVKFAEDRDFHFRLSLVTSVACVDKQLITTDRTPSPLGSTCRPWDSIELQFRGHQCMFNKWLRIGSMSPDVRRAIKRNLGALHSHEANWYLENARYQDARQAIRKAINYKITPGLTVKWALTWLAPAVARRIAPKTRPIGTGGHAS